MLLLLLGLYCFSGVKAEILYGMKGQSVCLDPGEKPPFETAKWSHGATVIFSNNVMNPIFDRKVDYHKSNATLCIRNLTKEDVGSYKFIYEPNFTNIEREFRLLVEDAVPKPAMSVTVEQVNVPSGLCIFNVNCSVHDLHLWSQCDQYRCRTAQQSSSEINITASIHRHKLFCVVHNHVSSKETSLQTEALCSSTGQDSPVSNYVTLALTTSALAIVVFLLLCFGARKFFLRRRQKQQPRVIKSQPIEQHSQLRISTSSSQADVSYENVDPETTASNRDGKADTVYCTLDLQPTSESQNFDGKTATKSLRMERSDHVDTLYNAIQKPHGSQNREK
ncbi:unnamed protein product [Knipowitschia caucasica]